MAMLVVKSATTPAALATCYQYFRNPRFEGMLAASMSAHVQGFLPGDLGDTPEAVDTGEGEV
jgi:hypothetical protein